MRLSILLFLLGACTTSFGQATDLKEFGLKGEVKTVTAYHLSFNEKSESYDLDINKSEMKIILFFNKKGNIDSSHSFSRNAPKDTYTFSRRVFYYKNGQKASYKQYDSNNKLEEVGTYKWLDKYTYSVTFDNGNRYKGYVKTSLNKNFREQSTEIKLSGSDQDYVNESYKNKLNEEDRIVQSDFLDKLENNFFKCSFDYLKTDLHNNVLEVIQSFPKYPERDKHIIRTIVYYN